MLSYKNIYLIFKIKLKSMVYAANVFLPIQRRTYYFYQYFKNESCTIKSMFQIHTTHAILQLIINSYHYPRITLYSE